MTIEVYPVIYSRTKFVDYIPDFLVCPEDFPSEEASRFVSHAIEDIFFSNGIRHLVFSVDKYYIYGGVACSSNSLIARIQSETGITQLDLEQEVYLNDEKGRPLVFFVGFAIKKSDFSSNYSNYIPDISLYETYKIFLKHLKKQWEEKTTKTERASAIKINLAQRNNTFRPVEREVFGKTVVENYSEQRYKDFIEHYFSMMTLHPKSNISFLSEVLSDNITEGYPFTTVSICDCGTDEAIAKIKGKLDGTSNKNGLTNQRSVKEHQFDLSQTRTKVDHLESQKKTLQRGFYVMLIAVIIIAIILTLVLKTAGPKNVHYFQEEQRYLTKVVGKSNQIVQQIIKGNLNTIH